MMDLYCYLYSRDGTLQWLYSAKMYSVVCKGKIPRQKRAQTLVETMWEESCSAGVATGLGEPRLHHPQGEQRRRE